MARVTEIRYVGYAVPDLEIERRFYTDTWGLTEAGGEDGLVYLAAPGTPERFVVRLRRAEQRRVDVIAWSAGSRAEVDVLYSQAIAAGAQIIAQPVEFNRFGGGYGFRCFDPDGQTLEISADVVTGPSRELRVGEAVPSGVSHVVLHAPDIRKTVAFYEKALGFKVSDWLGEFMCFLRCNSWHHRLAFVPGPACLNHVAYDLPSVDDMMRGIGRLKRNQVAIKWGPGRHTAGNNTFSYFTTPADFVVEYTSGLETVNEETWQPKVYAPAPDIMDQWGSGVGSPKDLPLPRPDPGLWHAPSV